MTSATAEPLSTTASLIDVGSLFREVSSGLRRTPKRIPEKLFYDEKGAIGRRYRRQDEIGTPYCVTVDFDTLDDDAVTVRDRDSMAQERVGLTQVRSWLGERLPGV